MAHIYIYSPSGAVRDRAAFRRGVKRLQALGHEVEIDPDALASWQRFAGDDDTRLAAIGRAAASGADVALISRGGYGLSRLLPRIPWRKLSRAAGQGTRLVGFSDFTVLQLGLLARESARSWSGPALCEGFGAAEPVGVTRAQADRGKNPVNGMDEIALACFQDLIDGSGEGTGWRLPAADLAALHGREGRLAHQAVLWGGNLTLVNSLLGTPWWPGVDKGVLFLEDVGEHPYRVERMLLQLLHAGVLARQKAVLLGHFTDYALGPHDRGFALQKVVARLRDQLRVPILSGLPFGHVPTKVLLPVGAPVDLWLHGREVLLLWGHLH